MQVNAKMPKEPANLENLETFASMQVQKKIRDKAETSAMNNSYARKTTKFGRIRATAQSQR